MISHEELGTIAKTRLLDARMLHKNGRYDGALYLCGYAIELGLKAMIAKNLNATGSTSTSHIPSTMDEFEVIKKLPTHNLDVLLGLIPSNVQQKVKTTYLADWSLIQKWNPEMRYAPIRGAAAKDEAGRVIEAVYRVLGHLTRKT